MLLKSSESLRYVSFCNLSPYSFNRCRFLLFSLSCRKRFKSLISVINKVSNHSLVKLLLMSSIKSVWIKSKWNHTSTIYTCVWLFICYVLGLCHRCSCLSDLSTWNECFIAVKYIWEGRNFRGIYFISSSTFLNSSLNSCFVFSSF